MEIAGSLAHESGRMVIRCHDGRHRAACEQWPGRVERLLRAIESSRPRQRAAQAHERVARAECVAGPAMKGDCTAERPNPLYGIAELAQKPEPEPQACADPLRCPRAAARQCELDASNPLAAQRPQEPGRTGVRRDAYADRGI